jgi:3-oxoacyl-[acyl-carrier-protein] synthase-3
MKFPKAHMRAQILSTGGYLPGEVVTTDEIERRVGPLTPDVAQGLSIQRRYWIADPDTGEHRENNSDMAYKAAKQALDGANTSPDEIDLMILATGTPDYPLPPVVNLVQDRLGVKNCATLEIRSGGAGAVQALDIARMYLERGIYRTAIVIGSEAISPVLVPVYLGRDPERIRMRDRIPLYMFGDGAGAILVGACDEGPGMEGFDMACMGYGKKPGIHSIGGGTHMPIQKQQALPRMVDLRVDVVEAGNFTPYMITQALSRTLNNAGVAAEEIDLCLIPEGNVGWMLDELHDAGLLTPEWVAMDGKIFDNLAMTGATGCAAVPLFLDEAWRTGRIKPGDKILIMGLESTKWIYAGMVLTWSAPTPSSEATTVEAVPAGICA